MKKILLLGMTVLSTLSVHAIAGSSSQDEVTAVTGSTTVTPGNTITIDEKRLTIKKSSDSDGNILLISNRTAFDIRVYDNQNMDTLIDPGSALSWGCTQDDYIASYVLETTSGVVIESLLLSCGDVLYVIEEGLGT